MSITARYAGGRAFRRDRVRGRLRVAHFPPGYCEDPTSYVGLLLDALERRGVAVVRLSRLTPRCAERQAEIDVVHLHWLEFIAPSDPRPLVGLFRTLARGTRLIVTLLRLQQRGVGIVWTVHNIEPHEPVRPRLESALVAAVMRLCDQAIVHSDYARRLVGQRYGHVEKVAVIPHGNYVGVFPPDPRASNEIRDALAVPRGAFVFLAFGKVRTYKRLVELVSAFSTLQGDDIRLLIAGEPVAAAEAARLRAAAQDDVRVILDLRRIPNDEVCAIHRSADAAVLAYRDVFSSGALLLALSYGLPVVAPDVGTAPELVRAPAIETFAPGGLAGALERMRHGDRLVRTRRALQAAEECSWERVGEATVALYERASVRVVTSPEAT